MSENLLEYLVFTRVFLRDNATFGRDHGCIGFKFLLLIQTVALLNITGSLEAVPALDGLRFGVSSGHWGANSSNSIFLSVHSIHLLFERLGLGRDLALDELLAEVFRLTCDSTMAASALLDKFAAVLYLDISVLLVVIYFWLLVLIWLINGLISIHLEWFTGMKLIYLFVIRTYI